MNKKMMLTAATVLLGATLMTACSEHSNVLLTANKMKAAEFIVSAELYALTHGKIPGFVDSGFYGKCYRDIEALDNPFKKESHHKCTDFLNQMVAYAKTTKDFKTVTVSDLTNEKVYSRLERYISDFETTEGDSDQMKGEEKRILDGKD